MTTLRGRQASPMRAVQSNGLARDPSGSGVVQKGLVMVTTCYNHGNLHKWGYIPYNTIVISLCTSGTASPSGLAGGFWLCWAC